MILPFILFTFVFLFVSSSFVSSSDNSTSIGLFVYSRFTPYDPANIPDLEDSLGVYHRVSSSHSSLPWSVDRPFIRHSPVLSDDPGLDWTQEQADLYRLFSIIAYDPIDQISSWSCFYCFSSSLSSFNLTSVIHDDSTDTLAFTGTLNEQFYIVYRGSDNVKNILLDLKVWKASQPLDGLSGVYTAAGFYKCFLALQSAIQHATLQALNENQNLKINLIGHSLGAAIASIFAVDFSVNMNLAVNCYSFGSPRVGNEAFVEAFESSVNHYWRMVNTFDPVPHVPPNLFNFLHVGHEVWQYNPTAAYIHCDWTLNEDPNCSKSVKDWLIRLAIHDHQSYMNISDGADQAYSGKLTNEEHVEEQ
jgi:hypothetical protein